MSEPNYDIEIREYINQLKEMYDLIIAYIDNPDKDSEEDFIILQEFINSHQIQQNKETFNHFIGIIVNLANDHHRQAGFFKKIERVLLKYQESIKNNNSNLEIFEKFESNKRLLYFLIIKQILTIDKMINELIINKIESNEIHYSDFFLHEITKSENNDNCNSADDIEQYEEKRQIGENDSYICSLIRQDSIEEFIKYVNQINISLSSKIKPSIFETNSFLIGKEPSLIEYAAFFGSIQIFQYLFLNKVEINGSIWNYAIHSNNSHFFRNYIECIIQPEDETYIEVLMECIKCHHNDIAIYIQDNLIKEKDILFDERIFDCILYHHNYCFLSTDINQEFSFYYLYKYNYTKIVDVLIKLRSKIIESKITIQEAANNNEIEIIYYLLSKENEIKKEIFKRVTNMVRIAIPPSIKCICEKSFDQCTNLVDVIIPSSVTSIQNYAFSQCSSLTQILIPSSVTSIGEYAFYGCESLTEVIISSSITEIKNSTFRNCSSLQKINIPPFVTSIGDSAFDQCMSLIHIKIPSSVTSIGDSAFYQCFSLKQITIPSSVTSIGCYAFYNCHNLKKIQSFSKCPLIGYKAFSRGLL